MRGKRGNLYDLNTDAENPLEILNQIFGELGPGIDISFHPNPLPPNAGNLVRATIGNYSKRRLFLGMVLNIVLSGYMETE